MYYPSICLERLRKTMKNMLREVAWDLNLGPPKYKGGLLPTQPQHSVPWIWCYIILTLAEEKKVKKLKVNVLRVDVHTSNIGSEECKGINLSLRLFNHDHKYRYTRSMFYILTS
jgi:hypothetical protein